MISLMVGKPDSLRTALGRALIVPLALGAMGAAYATGRTLDNVLHPDRDIAQITWQH